MPKSGEKDLTQDKGELLKNKGDANQQPEPEIQRSLKLQAYNKYELERFCKNYKKTKKERLTKEYIKKKQQILEDLWKQCYDTHKLIISQFTSDFANHEYFEKEQLNDLEDLYCAISGLMVTQLKDYEPDTNPIHNLRNNFTEPSNEIKLPHIKIPQFSGNYESWSSFHDLFEAIVHKNQQISNVQKLHYLKTNLTGEAAQLIKHLQLVDANYLAAWQLLKNRYDNRRILVSTQLQLLTSLPSHTLETSILIRRMLDKINEVLEALKGLEVSIENWDPLLIHILTAKLSKETIIHWEAKLSSRDNPTDLPTIKLFTEFLESRFRTLEAIHGVKGGNNIRKVDSHIAQSIAKPFPYQSKNFKFNNAFIPACPVCKGNHKIKECSKFLAMNTKTRHEFIKQQHRCINCFSSKHITKDCPNQFGCQKCNNRHNTLLHFANEKMSYVPNKSPLPPAVKDNQNTHASYVTNQTIENEPMIVIQPEINNLYAQPSTSKITLLATALINVYSPNQGYVTLRALLDQGSQASFITERAAQLLSIKRSPTNVIVTGIGSTKTEPTQYVVNLDFAPHFDSTRHYKIEAYIIKSITGLLPARKLEIGSNWHHLRNLQLADPLYLNPSEIDILLGADIYSTLIDTEQIRGPIGTPFAQKTTLGWILSGPIQQEIKSSFLINIQSDTNVSDLLKRFWEVEQYETKQLQTFEEDLCEKIYASTHRRTSDGKYVVALPFKSFPNEPSLGESKIMAVKRFLTLERKLQANNDLKTEYIKFMQEYEVLGHMICVKENENNHQSSTYYLPHHAVFKVDSTTTKTRVVFDASAKTSNKLSLNDTLLIGPKIQQDLNTILLRWRKHQVAFTADVEKMYRQILVTPEHTKYQKILWRDDPNKPIKEYKLMTVTYGTASAPYLAIKTLQQLALDEKVISEDASQTIINDFYVDDLLSGADSVEEAMKLQKDIRQILSKGKLRLRKWASNNSGTLHGIPNDDLELKCSTELNINDTIKALGIYWNPSRDVFQFIIKERDTTIQTKRQLLSQISKLYDPLGWLAPIIIKTKILMQQLWLSGTNWDDTIPNSIKTQWVTFNNELKSIENIRIPRWISYRRNNQNWQIHGFCDASMHAYAAAVYLRVEENSVVNVELLTAKTRVAPIKQISLPRLELAGAVLLTKLTKATKSSLQMESVDTFLWTDSTIVLAWLRSHPSRWKTFIANRVTEILENMENAQWGHIASAENPADCASRGINPNELENHSLWWKGPHWLSQKTSDWPKNICSDYTTKLEERKLITTNLHVSENIEENIIEKFSTLRKLLRVTAWCKRFINNCKLPLQSRYKCHLTNHEIDVALACLIIKTQLSHFKLEISALKSHQQISSNSKILDLHPQLDERGILRVGGRLKHSNLPYNQKHPIILPRKAPLTKLIINDVHKKTLHGGVQLSLNVLRRNYWIPRARQLIRSEIHRCIICFKFKARTQQQLMGNLPEYRVTISRPFLNTGIDFCGPFTLKESKCRGRPKTSKGYVCIFICLVTKAIHLEATSDLSTEAFLAAFRRFTSRRGLCNKIFSDCGTNFVGANNKLIKEKLYEQWGLTEDVYPIIAEMGIEWNFIPPGSPHFGGLWESGVKSTKHHLRRIMGNVLWTYEELSTCLTQIEACLNSRPLCPLSDDPEDVAALTPGHFLIGDILVSHPEENLLEHRISTLRRWQQIQKIQQDFWHRWSAEYLSRLQQRPKWLKQTPNIKEGTLVLVKDERLPPTKWLLGRVIELHPGKDGLVRVVTLKCKDGILKRPIVKVCVLPIEEVNEDEQPDINN